ncbi:MAG TPA: hypothetical protein DEQ40_05790 [Oxalobacteraceae bacterium]|nr:hypothetical protein [Oxalobacteraceae bacterium]
MRALLFAAFLGIIGSLSGCQALVYGTATDFERLSVGMNKAQVIEAIGQPVSYAADGDKGEEYLIYKRMSHAISAWPRDYVVTMKGNKLVRYGEATEH